MVTSEFAEEIRHELNCQTVFTIPGVNIGVKESIVVSWIIIAVVVLLCMLLVRNLSVDKPGKVQLLMESCVEALNNMLAGMVGPHATEYIPFLATVLIYIGIALLALICLYPFVNVLAYSFSGYNAVLSGRVTFYPIDFTVDAYKEILKRPQLWLAMRTTVILHFFMLVPP